MLTRSVWPALLSAAVVSAQSLTILGATSTTGSAIGDLPTGTDLIYLSLSSTKTLLSGTSTSASGFSSLTASNGTASSRSSSASNSITVLGGATTTSRLNGTASNTSTAARPTNSQPCNGYPEFCNRSYSNITEVAAHNFPFVKKNNAGSNQALPVTDQLNDGIRMREFRSYRTLGCSADKYQSKLKLTGKTTPYGFVTPPANYSTSARW
jgi:hypothetical protein